MENKVLATVESVKITELDVENFIKRLNPQQASQYQTEEGKKQILQELINQNLFLVDARKTNLENTIAFNNEMDKMKDMVLTQLNINNLMQSVEVQDSEVKDYFNQNRKKYSTPEKADTSHILVDTKEECEEIQQKLKADEISFEDAAKNYSKCPSKSKGGNLGLFQKGKMVPEYEAIAFDMDTEEISEPVKTQFGYHLIKLNEKQAASEAEFKEVKTKAKKDLISTKQREKYTAKVNEMRKQFNIEMA